MTIRILVAYASKKGSTAGIAQAIGKELQAAGYSVDIAETRAVSSVSGYNAVVFGGPVYMGRVAGEVGKFAGKFRDVLSTLPVAAFTVGIAPVSNDPAAVENMLHLLRDSIAPLRPVAETAFAGKIDPDQLSFIQKWMVKKVKSPVGDFRDWEAIARWAGELPGKMGFSKVPGP